MSYYILWYVIRMSLLLTIVESYEKDHDEFGYGRCGAYRF